MSTSSPKYAKQLHGVQGVPLSTPPAEGAEPEPALRVTLGDMDLEDAFRVTLPPDHASLSIGRLLDLVFCTDEANQAKVRARFDLKDNPDLPDMYDALLEVFDEWRGGRCSLRFFANHGPEIELSDGAREHLRPGPGETEEYQDPTLLDIVIEQRYRPVQYAAGKGYGGDRRRLLKWAQDLSLLYLVDGLGIAVTKDQESEAGRLLLPIARRLSEQGLLQPSQDSGAFEITEAGGRVLAGLASEAESYIDRYDVFKDVLYQPEPASVRFDTGRGYDLRVQVYEAEGLDPFRVVFLLSIYDSTLESLAGDRPDSIHQEEFFDELLAPLVDRDSVEKPSIDWIVESGFAHVEEREEALRTLDSSRRVLAMADSSPTTPGAEVKGGQG